MEPGQALDPVRQPAAGQPAALLILDMHVMVGLSPVHPGENQPAAPPGENGTISKPEISWQPANRAALTGASSHQLSAETSPAGRGTI